MTTFKENYPVKSGYQRHDPGRNGNESKPLGYKTMAGKSWRIKQGLPGFSLLDYSFRDAAYLANHQTNGEPEGMNRGYYSWTPLGVSVKPKDTPKWRCTPEKAAMVISKAAKYYGALDVRFTRVDERWFYTHTREGKPIVFEPVESAYETPEKAVFPSTHKWVIVMTVPIDYRETQYTPTPLFAAGGMAYSRMHILAGTVAEFIRGLGWNAIPSGNDMTLNVPIALQAGIGHLGRMNRVITWEHGPLVKICKVFTDLPLPQSPQAPPGIMEYCEVCKKCSKLCPGEAIGDGSRSWEPPGVFKWSCDEEKCRDYWDDVGTSCTVCYRVCAFAKKPSLVHSVVLWFIRNIPQLNRLWVLMDDLLGYGKRRNPNSYWED